MNRVTQRIIAHNYPPNWGADGIRRQIERRFVARKSQAARGQAPAKENGRSGVRCGRSPWRSFRSITVVVVGHCRFAYFITRTLAVDVNRFCTPPFMNNPETVNGTAAPAGMLLSMSALLKDAGQRLAVGRHRDRDSLEQDVRQRRLHRHLGAIAGVERVAVGHLQHRGDYAGHAGENPRRRLQVQHGRHDLSAHPAESITAAVTLIRPVGRGSVQSLYQYSPSRSNVYWNVWPGCSFGLNKPSKNCVAQCSFRLGKSGNVSAPGFRKVTVVPSCNAQVVRHHATGGNRIRVCGRISRQAPAPE